MHKRGILTGICITVWVHLVKSEIFCQGEYGPTCCNGFRWNAIAGRCIKCDLGFTGIDCALKCLHPYYGDNCQMKCTCAAVDCHYAFGCTTSRELDFMETTIKSAAQTTSGKADDFTSFPHMHVTDRMETRIAQNNSEDTKKNSSTTNTYISGDITSTITIVIAVSSSMICLPLFVLILRKCFNSILRDEQQRPKTELCLEESKNLVRQQEALSENNSIAENRNTLYLEIIEESGYDVPNSETVNIAQLADTPEYCNDADDNVYLTSV